jgi:hypothetical protein
VSGELRLLPGGNGRRGPRCFSGGGHLPYVA